MDQVWERDWSEEPAESRPKEQNWERAVDAPHLGCLSRRLGYWELYDGVVLHVDPSPHPIKHFATTIGALFGLKSHIHLASTISVREILLDGKWEVRHLL